MRVLVACEFSGIVRDAFICCGHEALSCDLLPTEVPGPHYEGDVMDILDDGWDLIVAHPPCRFLSNSGVQWLHKEEGRWERMRTAANFFNRFLDVSCSVCIENPVQHKYARDLIVSPTQYVQPYYFGDRSSKKTGLWLRGLPLLEPTDVVEPSMVSYRTKRGVRRFSADYGVQYGEAGRRRRSRFYPGMARAMAEQWGMGR